MKTGCNENRMMREKQVNSARCKRLKCVCI